MIRHTKRAIVFIIGLLLVFLGVLGLFLPFLQGILFIVLGLFLLSIFSPTLREAIERQTRKFPKVHAQVVKVQQFVDRIIGEVEKR